jgi:hypothetical protein
LPEQIILFLFKQLRVLFEMSEFCWTTTEDKLGHPVDDFTTFDEFSTSSALLPTKVPMEQSQSEGPDDLMNELSKMQHQANMQDSLERQIRLLELRKNEISVLADARAKAYEVKVRALQSTISELNKKNMVVNSDLGTNGSYKET